MNTALPITATPEGWVQGEIQAHGVWRKWPADTMAYSLAFAHWFGVANKPARVLVTLYAAKGENRTLFELSNILDLSAGAIHTNVHTLRQAMDTEAIDCQRVLGYRLTEEGLAECRGALWSMGELLRRAS